MSFDFPIQAASKVPAGRKSANAGLFDMRECLDPCRLTIAMWDQGYLFRHIPGESFENYDKVLDEASMLGYNTLRIDPMPHLIDLQASDKVFKWSQGLKFLPWGTGKAGDGPLGYWLLEFMKKIKNRELFYTLSTWWGTDVEPKPIYMPKNHKESAEIWCAFLRGWEKQVGFDHLVYVDISNEVPYFLPGYMNLIKEKSGVDWNSGNSFSASLIQFLAEDLNSAMDILHREFPGLLFTASIHGDPRWLDVPLDFDCLDVHFYADKDRRWLKRTCFDNLIQKGPYTDDSLFKNFSDRCMLAHKAAAPMFRARQRHMLSLFAEWAERMGMPLTTSESWASWFYLDHPHLDWGWLLDWAAWTVEDALEFNMWGWTPHNYLQPQFKNWYSVEWHKKLTSKFLGG